MDWHFTIIGLMLLGLTLYDFAYTTISINKTGPATRWVATRMWAAFRRLENVPFAQKLRRLAGPAILSGVASVWVASTSIGWLLIFMSHPQSLTMKTSDTPAGWAETLAFVGSALSTVGASNAKPASALWDNLAMVIAVNGMIVLTLSVSFVFNITQTVAQGRGFTTLVRVRDPANPDNDDMLLSQLSALCAKLNASPLALYYSARKEERSLPHSLLWLADRVSGSPDRFQLYRYVLSELPYLETKEKSDHDDFMKAIEGWTRKYSLVD